MFCATQWFSPCKREPGEPNRKFTEPEEVKASSLHLTVFFFTDFFVLPSHVINFAKSNHQSRFPVLVLSIWFWPKLQTNAPVQVWAQDSKFLFCSDCFQHSGRMFSVCLSGVGQVLLLKVLFIKSIKSVPKGKLPSAVLPQTSLSYWLVESNKLALLQKRH